MLRVVVGPVGPVAPAVLGQAVLARVPEPPEPRAQAVLPAWVLVTPDPAEPRAPAAVRVQVSAPARVPQVPALIRLADCSKVPFTLRGVRTLPAAGGEASGRLRT